MPLNISQRMAFKRTSGQTFFGVSALVFDVSSAVTLVCSVHVLDGWHADARRLDNGNDVDILTPHFWPIFFKCLKVGNAISLPLIPVSFANINRLIEYFLFHYS
jgi:hypothetical protein